MEVCIVFIVLFAIFLCCCVGSCKNKKQITRMENCVYVMKEFNKFVEFVIKNDVKIKRIDIDINQKCFIYSVNRHIGADLLSIDIIDEFNRIVDLYCENYHDGVYVYTHEQSDDMQ